MLSIGTRETDGVNTRRTNDELDEEEEDVNYEQKDYACFAGHRGRMQARGRRRTAQSSGLGNACLACLRSS